MILTGDRRRATEIDPEFPIVDQFVEVLSAAGEPLAKWSIYEILSAGRFPFRRDSPPRAIDLLHANNVELLDLPQLAGRGAIYAPGNLLVTLRHQDAVVVIDPAAQLLAFRH